jgi:hypothetical protein
MLKDYVETVERLANVKGYWDCEERYEPYAATTYRCYQQLDVFADFS